MLLLLLQVAAELDKGTLAEPPPGWIRPGEVADTAEESGSSGEPANAAAVDHLWHFSPYITSMHSATAWLQLNVVY
jgi:hypothetical protein